eukprot:c5815_g1_i1.p1 GENE.c5815_g1_i1~~c5815_g1_i1.p1  ORF type:complete len:272 (+),score=77.31 c5815_g1_i1:103-816(+)
MDMGIDPNSPQAQRFRQELGENIDMLTRELNALQDASPAEKAKKHIAIAEHMLHRAILEREPAETRKIVQESLGHIRSGLDHDPSLDHGHFQHGNALNMLAFSTHSREQAQRTFDLATQSFQQAVELAPSNPTYRTYLENNSQAIFVWEQIMAASAPVMPADDQDEPPEHHLPRPTPKTASPPVKRDRASRRANFKYELIASVAVAAVTVWLVRKVWNGTDMFSGAVFPAASANANQ